ncbi:30S ribosomal protein S27e [Candidatus Micrarchaeota archaeon]|nr:30S ribosomal protein S27e [Candidatus Micrarchaeota archaeon]
MAKSKFLKVKCECGNEQSVFGCTGTAVSCTACNKILAEPRGGHANVYGKILKANP